MTDDRCAANRFTDVFIMNIINTLKYLASTMPVNEVMIAFLPKMQKKFIKKHHDDIGIYSSFASFITGKL
jgi:hypothetical protein